MTITVDISAAPGDVHIRRTLLEISLAVVRSKRIVVVTGAGISCSGGIPDFRSSDGLYALVKQKYPDVVLKGRDLFDASLFRDSASTAVFYTFISRLKRAVDAASPTPTHHFIKTLDAKKKLLRSYTQNIDGLEERTGLLGTSCEAARATTKGKNKLKIKDVRNVQLHGDIHRVRCVSCSAEFPCAETHLSKFSEGFAPDCPECLTRSEARVARSARPIKVGTLRPAIVLYDEPHPLGDDIGSIQTADIGRKPDLLIIMGTSLKVHGLKKLVKEFAKTVRQPTTTLTSRPKPKVIFVNKTPPGSEWGDVIDYHVASGTDAWVAKVLEDWRKNKPTDWEIQQTLDGDTTMASPLKTIKPNAEASKKKKVSNKKPPHLRDENTSPVESPQVPTSPSKRRQATCHYSDLESSPSKRQSTKPLKLCLPSSERRLLFGESTNQAKAGLEDTIPMDVSLAELSMRDIEGIEKPSAQAVPSAHKAKTTRARSAAAKGAAPTTKRRATAKRSKS